MKRKLSFLVVVVGLLFCFIPNVFAEEYIVLNTNKYFRSKPGGSLLTEAVTDGVLLSGYKVIVLDKNTASGNGCKNSWYKVRYHESEGYICSSDQVVQETASVDMNADFEQQMLQKGFPKSYLPYLKALHQKHPNWTFSALLTNLSIDEASYNENIGDISVVDGSDESLRAVDSNGNFIPSNEKGWYIASRSTVKYYMDPRNFLSEAYIFMFENLGYHSAVHTRKAVAGVTAGTFLATDEYLDLLMKSAATYHVSPVYLASRIRQEKGTTGGLGTDGAPFTFAVDQSCLASQGYHDSSSWNAKNDCGSGLTYQGIYNFYNIGAYSAYQSAVIRGLIWGNGGFDASVTSYLRPWNSKEKAILGGASYIAEKFISKGQHTLYLQRFNVAPGASYPTYTHQYMTNIRAHASEAYKIYQSYQANDLLENDYEFLIPVYQGLDDSSSEVIPDSNDEKEEEVPVMAISTALTGRGYKIDQQWLSGIGFNRSIDTLKSDLRSTYDKMQVVSFKDKYGNTAGGNIGTGDTLTISNGKDTVTYTALVYGDNNGDGKTTILDLLRVQKYILGSGNLSDVEVRASDTNRDGKVNVVDLLRIQKQIIGNIQIEQ